MSAAKTPKWVEATGIMENVDKALLAKRDKEVGRGYIGASVLGGPCDRKLWYGFRWWAPPAFPARILRRFDDGHTMEERVVEDLREAGYEVHNVNPRARNEKKQYAAYIHGGIVGGHIDGFIRGNEFGDEYVLLEIKVMVSAKYEQDENGEPFKNKRQKLKTTDKGGKRQTGDLTGTWFKLHNAGVLKAKVQHWAQMQVYMGASHGSFVKWGLSAPLKRALYIAVNSDTQAWHCELIEYYPQIHKRLVDRGLSVAKHRESPPPRLSENPGHWTCKYCDYLADCHRELPPRSENCRNCRFADLVLPGESDHFGKRPSWRCREHGCNCPNDFAKCDEYEPIEQNEHKRAALNGPEPEAPF